MRTCDTCGTKMPFGVKRTKNADGNAQCEGCKNGRPGRPRSQGMKIALAGRLRVVATGEPCTVQYADGSICGKPAVTSFTARNGETYFECAEHAWVEPSGAAPTGQITVGSTVNVRYSGRDTTGVVEKAGPVLLQVRVRLMSGSDKLVQFRRDEVTLARTSGRLEGVSFQRSDWFREAAFPATHPTVPGMAPQPPAAMPPHPLAGAGAPPPGAPGAAPPHPGAPGAPGAAGGAPGEAAMPLPETPEQVSDQKVWVCPFCGSGDVTGGSDGTIECGSCSAVFQVEVKPKHPNQPKVDPKTGQPFDAGEDDDYPELGAALSGNEGDPLADDPLDNDAADPGQPPAEGEHPKAQLADASGGSKPPAEGADPRESLGGAHGKTPPPEGQDPRQ